MNDECMQSSVVPSEFLDTMSLDWFWRTHQITEHCESKWFESMSPGWLWESTSNGVRGERWKLGQRHFKFSIRILGNWAPNECTRQIYPIIAEHYIDITVHGWDCFDFERYMQLHHLIWDRWMYAEKIEMVSLLPVWTIFRSSACCSVLARRLTSRAATLQGTGLQLWFARFAGQSRIP